VQEYALKIFSKWNGIVLENEDYIVSCCKMEHAVLNFAYSINEKRSPKFFKERALACGVTPGPDFGTLQRGFPVKVGNKIVTPEKVLGKERRGRKIVYSGDTGPCDQMIKFSKDADILVHESTFNDSHHTNALETGHSTASMAAKIAKKADVKMLILTHISTRYRDTKTIENEAAKIFENIIVADDMMVWEVKQHEP